MQVGYNNAERLIRTELNYIRIRAAADSIVSAEMGYYQFIAVMDNRTTPICQSLDGEIFPIIELSQGENAPPMHVRCRSTIAASEDDGKQGRKPVGQRAARDEEGKRIKIPADMTYRDWKAVYIDKTRTLEDWRKAKDAEYAAARGVVSGSVDSLPFKGIKGFHTINEDLKAVNPNYKPDTEWSRNCQRCAPTYELRRRGYDVTAKPVNDIRKDFLSRGGNYAKVFENPQIIRCTGDVVKTIRNYMMIWGNGSRAEVFIRTKGTNDAHIFVAENRLGEVVFIDPQRALENVEDYFEDAQEGYTFILRMDNLNFTKFINDCCEEVKK